MPFPPTFTNNWDVTFPPDTQLANLLGQDLRNFRVDVMQRMSLLSGLFANRPTPEIVNATWGGAGYGLIYISTDTNQIFQWNGAAWVDISGSISGSGSKLIGTNIVPVTVANTVAQTALQGINVPANSLGAGQTFYFDCAGVMGAVGPGLFFQITPFLDGQIIDGGCPIILSLATANNQLWSLRGFFTCLTTGVAGTLHRPNLLWMSSPSMNGTFNNGTAFGAGFTVDTTVAHTLQLKVIWGVANASNTITQDTMTVYRVG